MVAIEAFTAADGHHGHTWFVDQRIELVKIAGVWIDYQRQVNLLRLRLGPVMQSIFFRQGMAHHGEEGNRGNTGARVQPVHGVPQ